MRCPKLLFLGFYFNANLLYYRIIFSNATEDLRQCLKPISQYPPSNVLIGSLYRPRCQPSPTLDILIRTNPLHAVQILFYNVDYRVLPESCEDTKTSKLVPIN